MSNGERPLLTVLPGTYRVRPGRAVGGGYVFAARV